MLGRLKESCCSLVREHDKKLLNLIHLHVCSQTINRFSTWDWFLVSDGSTCKSVTEPGINFQLETISTPTYKWTFPNCFQPETGSLVGINFQLWNVNFETGFMKWKQLSRKLCTRFHTSPSNPNSDVTWRNAKKACLLAQGREHLYYDVIASFNQPLVAYQSG